MKNAPGIAVLLVLLVLLALFWRTMRTPAPVLETGQANATPVPAAAELGSCDRQPPPPTLPDTLSPASPDIAGIVRALDSALNDQHKAWLRCFTLDDELLGRTQNGFGRWLRTTLRLRRPPLLTALGATSPDEASSIIILVYAAHLRGQELSPADAKVRRVEALANGGVTR